MGKANRDRVKVQQFVKEIESRFSKLNSDEKFYLMVGLRVVGNMRVKAWTFPQAILMCSDHAKSTRESDAIDEFAVEITNMLIHYREISDNSIDEMTAYAEKTPAFNQVIMVWDYYTRAFFLMLFPEFLSTTNELDMLIEKTNDAEYDIAKLVFDKAFNEHASYYD